MCFFFLCLTLSYLQSTLSNLYGKRRETPSPPLTDFAQHHHGLNRPSGKEFAMFIPRFDGFSHGVAWGHHLRYHYEAGMASHALPGVKNMPQSTEIVCDDGTISVIVTIRILGKEERRHPRPPATRLPTPSQDPSRHALYLFCIVKARAVHIIHCAWSQNYQRFCFDYTQSFGRPHQPLLAAPSSRK